MIQIIPGTLVKVRRLPCGNMSQIIQKRNVHALKDLDQNCSGDRSYRSHRSYRSYRSYRSSARCAKRCQVWRDQPSKAARYWSGIDICIALWAIGPGGCLVRCCFYSLELETTTGSILLQETINRRYDYCLLWTLGLFSIVQTRGPSSIVDKRAIAYSRGLSSIVDNRTIVYCLLQTRRPLPIVDKRLLFIVDYGSIVYCRQQDRCLLQTKGLPVLYIVDNRTIGLCRKQDYCQLQTIGPLPIVDQRTIVY